MDAKWLRNSFVYLIILVAVMAILFSLFQGNSQPNNRNITDVLGQVQKDVASGITTDKLVVSGNKITADTAEGQMVTYKTDNDSILQLLHNSNIGYNQVSVEEQPPSQLGSQAKRLRNRKRCGLCFARRKPVSEFCTVEGRPRMRRGQGP